MAGSAGSTAPRRGRPTRATPGAIHGLSPRAQREAGDLARREEADLLPGEAEAAVHVHGRIAVAVEAAVEGADELGEVAGAAPGPGERELAAVGVAGEHEGGPEPRRLRKAVGPVGEHDERAAGGHAGGERRERGMLEDAARPVATQVVDAEERQHGAADRGLDALVAQDAGRGPAAERGGHRGPTGGGAG